ncbi:MAG: hypothetical protein O7G86_10585 [Gammaproteobacteria bacterium]|nr:hypothetical protein [Gammaproteobacteria bacterium]
MKRVLKTKWRSFMEFVEAFDTGSSYPFEQIRELQFEVAKLKAAGSERVVSTESER